MFSFAFQCHILNENGSCSNLHFPGIGFTLPFACALGSLHSFGLMFNDFLANLGAGASSVTLVTGVFFSAMSFAGLCGSPLFKKFTIRSVGVFGAILYFAGSLMVIFVTSVEMLLVSFGLLQGSSTIEKTHSP